MTTLHIAPSDSAGGSIQEGLRAAGTAFQVLRFLDDLSCGPISPGDPSARAQWWARFGYDASECEDRLRRFWDRLECTNDHDRLVVWFGRHSAQELAFFLAWTDRLGDRPYDIVDVTARQLPYRRRDGSVSLSRPIQRVATMQPEAVQLLVGEERPITAAERAKSRQDWQRLQTANAPFRIVTDSGLVSAPVDHFDPLLLAQASSEWRLVSEVVHHAIGHTSEPYDQIGDMMLRARLVALVREGRLVADGDPNDRSTRIRLPR
jgi:hypothetical protein